MESKKSLDERLQDLKPTGADLNPKEIVPSKTVTTLQVEVTEKQLQHLIAQMRMIKIKFKII